ncbi:LysR family transcriptional regulator [Staphylococcus saprophyticus]|uniref:LysR family transcriptional regulator n=1 Tax=Staphylococcus saprophyticus TaxID=29385 RepID=UPI0034DD5D8B
MNRNYKYIETIINEGTITKAANKLYVSQPYLSNFIKNIEAEWNIIFLIVKNIPLPLRPKVNFIINIYKNKSDFIMM